MLMHLGDPQPPLVPWSIHVFLGRCLLAKMFACPAKTEGEFIGKANPRAGKGIWVCAWPPPPPVEPQGIKDECDSPAPSPALESPLLISVSASLSLFHTHTHTRTRAHTRHVDTSMVPSA